MTVEGVQTKPAVLKPQEGLGRPGAEAPEAVSQVQPTDRADRHQSNSMSASSSGLSLGPAQRAVRAIKIALTKTTWTGSQDQKQLKQASDGLLAGLSDQNLEEALYLLEEQGILQKLLPKFAPQDRERLLQRLATLSDQAKLDLVNGLSQSKGEANLAFAAAAIGYLRGDSAAQAFSFFSPDQLVRLFQVAPNYQTEKHVFGVTGPHVHMRVHTTVSHPRWEGLLEAINSVPHAADRGLLLGLGLEALAEIPDSVLPKEKAALALSVLSQLEGSDLLQLTPAHMAQLTACLACDPKANVQALKHLALLPSSDAKMALVRTLFLKTPSKDVAQDEALRRELATGLLDGNSVESALGIEDLAQILATKGGRQLLTASAVPGADRLWALQHLIDGTPEATAAVQAKEPWSHPELVELRAKVSFLPFEAHRPVAQVSGFAVDTFVGASIGASPRADYDPSKHLRDPNYNPYEGHRAVELAAAGLRKAQSELGESTRITTLPILYSSSESGPLTLRLYRVESEQGERYVDNTGAVYSSFEHWKRTNKLPPGKMTFPRGGRLAEPGQTALQTLNTPSTVDTGWERAKTVLDTTALVGGVAASGFIIGATGGAATPWVGVAWGVALGSAGYAGANAAGHLVDRFEHRQTLSLSDPDARAAWTTVVASGLSLAGAGLMRGATGLVARAGQGQQALRLAQAAGLLNAGANYLDLAATADQAYTLAVHWDRMEPAQRAMMALSMVFWAGMTGASAKASGGKLSDAFSFRAQMNAALLSTGAAIQENPDFASGYAAVRTGYDQDGHLNLRVEYGPGTSPSSVAIHQRVARELIDNSGVQGAIRRALGADLLFSPGTRGEEVALEVVKHRALVKAYRQAAKDASAEAKIRFENEAAFYHGELAKHEAHLAYLKQHPEQAQSRAWGTIEAKAPFDAPEGLNAHQWQALTSQGKSATDRAMGHRLFADGRREAVFVAINKEATAVASSTYLQALDDGLTHKQALKKANRAAAKTAKAEMAARSMAENKALVEESISNGTALKSDGIVGERLADYKNGLVGKNIRRLMPILAEAKNEAEFLAIMANEVAAGRAQETTPVGEQSMRKWELNDGSVVRMKPNGDDKRPGPNFSGEIKKSPQDPDFDQSSIAFKLDTRGRPVPKNDDERSLRSVDHDQNQKLAGC